MVRLLNSSRIHLSLYTPSILCKITLFLCSNTKKIHYIHITISLISFNVSYACGNDP